jgi:serine protease AprX
MRPDGSTKILRVVKALDYVLALREQDPITPMVLNNSWGLKSQSDSIKLAVERLLDLGVVVVGAAGNCGPVPTHDYCDELQGVSFPWSEIDDVIVVGAAGTEKNWLRGDEPELEGWWATFDQPDDDDAVVDDHCYIASFSSRAVPGQKIDLVAPGNFVFVPVSFFLKSGTSYAAPYVAGAAALLLDRDPSLTPQEVRSLLVESAIPCAPGQSYEDPIDGASAPWTGGPEEQGAGLLRVDRALELLN